MIFNSIIFFFFLPVVFLLYWFVFNKQIKWQNFFLLVASYVFYGWWDWRFLGLIVLSSTVDFATGILIEKADNQKIKKRWLWVSIFVNLGVLCVFKYLGFFVDSFVDAMQLLGLEINYSTLKIIFPVGISFYTFQTLSYSIDIYRDRLKATRDPIAFFTFVAFFPQLVAGPIERARNLLPQFFKERTFDYELARDGMRQILWGFFCKVVIADNLAVFVDAIFANSSEMGGSILLLGALLFGLQIYWDFSGYSDIAIGTAKLFGFKLKRNFAYVLFSRDIAEFWRRWHISLTTWIRDYFALFLPRKKDMAVQLRNTIIIFLAIGFWHGASWNFIFWGLANGLVFCWFIWRKKKRHLGIAGAKSKWPSLEEWGLMIKTFVLNCLIIIFFRSSNLGSAFEYYYNIVSTPFANPYTFWPLLDLKLIDLVEALFYVFLALFLEWRNRKKQHTLQFIEWPVLVRWSTYLIMTALILNYLVRERAYIYFQF